MNGHKKKRDLAFPVFAVLYILVSGAVLLLLLEAIEANQ